MNWLPFDGELGSEELCGELPRFTPLKGAEFPPSIHGGAAGEEPMPPVQSQRISSLVMDMGRVIMGAVINMEMIFGLIRMQQSCLLSRDVCTLQLERSDRYLNAVIKPTFKTPH